MAYDISGCVPKSISRQPQTLIVFEKNMTLPFGMASASAPTKGASTT